jgi:hypothetical protein
MEVLCYLWMVHCLSESVSQRFIFCFHSFMQDDEDEVDLLKKYLSGYRRKVIFVYFLLNRLFVLGLFLKYTIALIIYL